MIFIAPVLVLLISIYLLSIFITGVVGLWLQVTTFWGRVAYRNPDKIEYNFKLPKVTVLSGPVGFAGILWSVIKLAALL